MGLGGGGRSGWAEKTFKTYAQTYKVNEIYPSGALGGMGECSKKRE